MCLKMLNIRGHKDTAMWRPCDSTKESLDEMKEKEEPVRRK